MKAPCCLLVYEVDWKMRISDYCPQFFTATILEWKHLLAFDECKKIICNSLEWLVSQKRVNIHGFVIMPNHIHLIWHIFRDFDPSSVQHSFLTFTAQKMKSYLLENHPTFLKTFWVGKSDRDYQFWKRRPLSIDIYSQHVFWQKLNYIHTNPVQDRWQLCSKPEDYKYSSAKFYITGINDWPFLTSYY